MKAKPTYPDFVYSSKVRFEREHYPETFDIKQILTKTIVGEPVVNLPNKGYSEGVFCSVLNNAFPNKIYSNIGVKSNDLKTIFIPDFLYYDSNHNFHLGIEIDEPYILSNKEPIHWISDSWANGGDSAWDFGDDSQFFILKEFNKKHNEWDHQPAFRSDEIAKAGWFLIHFSERQVVQYPNECCIYIQNKINEIFDREINFETPLEVDPCWTREEAIEMAKTNYRESYLKDLKIEEIQCLSYNDYNDASKKWKDFNNRFDGLPF
jgi:hypothetical protein